MYERWIQTLDPDRFALDKVRYVVSKLQESGRDFIVMVDPATFSDTPNSSVDSYETYQTRVQQDVFLSTTMETCSRVSSALDRRPSRTGPPRTRRAGGRASSRGSSAPRTGWTFRVFGWI